jgi:hypothetical protein
VGSAAGAWWLWRVGLPLAGSKAAALASLGRKGLREISSWIVRALPAFLRVVFQLLEAAIAVAVVLLAGIGAWHYGIDTKWSLTGLLTLLDERWKGTMVLVGVLFYRSFQDLLARVQGPLKTPLGEIPIFPSAEPTQTTGVGPAGSSASK